MDGSSLVSGSITVVGVADCDGDGVPDDEDCQPDSDLSETIIIGDDDTGITNDLLEDGCTLSDLIADVLGADSSVSAFVQLLVDLKGDGLISGRDLGTILKTINSP